MPVYASQPRLPPPADRHLAPRLLSDGVRHRRGRRHDAAHPFGPVHRRVAADRGRDSSPERCAVGGDLRQVPGDARIQAAQPRHDDGGLQVDLLVGVFPPAARAARRRGLPRSLRVLPRHAQGDRRARLEAGGDLFAGRPAGRARLVHGEERPRRRSAGELGTTRGPPRSRLPDLRPSLLDRAGTTVAASQDELRLGAPPCRVPGGADLRDGALRGAGGRDPCRLCLQHMAPHGWRVDPAGDPHDRAVVAEPAAQHGDRAVHAPRDRHPRGARGADRLGARAA